MEKFVNRGDQVLLKPNLLTAKPPEAAVTTHPEVVRSVIRLVRQAGGEPFISDSPSAIGLYPLQKVSAKSGLTQIAAEEGVQVKDFSSAQSAGDDKGRLFKKLKVAKEALEADVVINLPKVKTHGLMTLTLSVKNLFGCVMGKTKAQWHLSAGSDKFYFASMLVEVYQAIKPALTVVDGIIGMEGDGPASGVPRQLGFVAAGSDCVAIDAVISHILGLDPAKLPVIQAATAKGIGQAEISKIEILGESIADLAVDNFAMPKTTELPRLAKGLSSILKKACTSKPLEDISKCTLCMQCASVCPTDIIKKSDSRLNFNYDKCIRCFCCQEVCPEGAMQIKQGWLLKLLS